MNNERPFENIIPVPNIKVGYFEKEEYLKIIDRQEKQIETSAYQIIALQSRIEILEKSQRPQGEWYYNYQNGWHCSICHESVKDMPTVMGKANFAFCPNCGAKLGKGGAE